MNRYYNQMGQQVPPCPRCGKVGQKSTETFGYMKTHKVWCPPCVSEYLAKSWLYRLFHGPYAGKP